jgi:hypothetical protein
MLAGAGFQAADTALIESGAITFHILVVDNILAVTNNLSRHTSSLQCWKVIPKSLQVRPGFRSSPSGLTTESWARRRLFGIDSSCHTSDS